MSNQPHPKPEFACARLGTSYLLFYPVPVGYLLTADILTLIQHFADAAGWKKDPPARPMVVKTRGVLVHNRPTIVIVGISCGVEFVDFSDLLNGTALEKLRASRFEFPAPLMSTPIQPPAKLDTRWQKQLPLAPFSSTPYQPPKRRRNVWAMAAMLVSLLLVVILVTVSLLPRTGQPAAHATPVALQTPTDITATPTQTPQISPLTLHASPSQVGWTVLQGQNLTHILLALHRQATWPAIVATAQANGVANPSKINAGQTLTIAVGLLIKVPANTALVTIVGDEITVRILTDQTDLRLVEAPALYANIGYQQEADQLLQGILIQRPPDRYQVFELQGFNLHSKTCHFTVSTADAQARVSQCLTT